MAPSDPSDNICVLVCAPFGHDAVSTVALLQEAGYAARALADLSDADALRDERIGALLLTEEALRHGDAGLTRALDAQEPWADLPILFLTAPRSRATPWHIEHVRFRLPPSATNVIVLERPIGAVSLVSAVASALRARRKQYEIRDSIAAQKRVADKLDELVKERTRDLEQALQQLRTEVADRERAEEQLRQAQKMEAVGQLTGGIAHDFNNMLAVIISSLRLAERRMARGEFTINDYIASAIKGAERAATLVSRLLSFSRQQPLSPQRTDVNRLLGGMEDVVRRTIPENITMEFVRAGGLWSVHIDPHGLESTLINLAVNARDSMQDGGKLTFETANAYLDDAYSAAHAEVKPGQYVLIAVTDTGHGMSSDVISRAFEPFFTTKEVGAGTGLGLSQVYGFVKQSQGHVKIYSELGVGTTVKLYIPRLVEKLVTSPEPVEVVNVAPVRGDGQSVLVVEDENDVRRLTVEILTELGFSVLSASTGAHALAVLDQNPDIVLIVTDVVMPGMNGRKLAEEALRRRPHLKVLFTTGYTRNAIVHNGTLDEGVELLAKPFTLEAIAAKIAKILPPK